ARERADPRDRRHGQDSADRPAPRRGHEQLLLRPGARRQDGRVAVLDPPLARGAPGPAEPAGEADERLVGLRDTLFGRTKPVAPKLDNLFALPTAALTLQSELDLVTSGQAGLCFKASSGQTEITSDDDLKELLGFDEADGHLSLTGDDLGFKWLVIHDT